MRIYLDMCCFNRPYDDQTQMRVALEAQAKLHIQNRIPEGVYDLIGSYILDYEVSRNPFDMRRNSITSFIRSTSLWKRRVNNDRQHERIDVSRYGMPYRGAGRR